MLYRSDLSYESLMSDALRKLSRKDSVHCLLIFCRKSISGYALPRILQHRPAA